MRKKGAEGRLMPGGYRIEGAAWKGPRPPRQVKLMVHLTLDQYEALKRGGKPMSAFIRELVARELEGKA